MESLCFRERDIVVEDVIVENCASGESIRGNCKTRDYALIARVNWTSKCSLIYGLDTLPPVPDGCSFTDGTHCLRPDTSALSTCCPDAEAMALLTICSARDLSVAHVECFSKTAAREYVGHTS